MARALGFLTCFIILLALTPTSNGQQVGYVLEIRGVWYLNGNPADTLRRWQPLPASSVIRVHSPSRYDAITVADMRGAILGRRECQTDCLTPIRLPPPPAQPTLVRGILKTAMEWLWGSPDRYIAARSRGAELSDGIAKLEHGKVDLNSLLNIQGQYRCRWRLLAPNEKVAAPAWSEAVELKPIISFSEFKAGLYEFQALRKVVTGLEPVSSAWVLVVLPEQYGNTQESYDQAVRLTKQWEGKVSPETVQAFLRAHLDELAQTRRVTGDEAKKTKGSKP